MTLEQALINNGTVNSIPEANSLISEMLERVHDGENPEEILYEVGLEPDYVFDILDTHIP